MTAEEFLDIHTGFLSFRVFCCRGKNIRVTPIDDARERVIFECIKCGATVNGADMHRISFTYF